MRDEIFARTWEAGHDRFSADLHALFVKIGDILARLHRINWSAPWRTEAGYRAGRIGQA